MEKTCDWVTGGMGGEGGSQGSIPQLQPAPPPQKAGFRLMSLLAVRALSGGAADRPLKA